ncbi:MAG TPA: helix-turn-helix domain-containing protein [Blastococcus sp.]|nr:helix-turn-helix domain-containing protein [Blastococcus sp.]
MDFAALGRTAARTNAIRFVGHEPHSHPVPHLVYVVAGTGLLTVEGRTLELCEGQGVWLPADVEHGLTLRDGGMAIGPLLGADAVPPGGRPRVVGPVPALSTLVTVLLCAAPEDDDERVPLRSALEDVLRTVTREHFPLTMPEHPVAQAIARAAARFDGTLDQLAERHYISARQVQRLFVDETGLTFARWRTRARLNLAIVSLRAGEGMRTAMQTSGFATRHGLLKALSRECGLPVHSLLTAPDGRLAQLAPLAA